MEEAAHPSSKPRNHGGQQTSSYRFTRRLIRQKPPPVRTLINPGVGAARDGPSSASSQALWCVSAAAASGRTEPGGASPTQRRARRSGLISTSGTDPCILREGGEGTDWVIIQKPNETSHLFLIKQVFR